MGDGLVAIPVVWDCMVLHDGPTTIVPCETPGGDPVVLLLDDTEAQNLARLLLLKPGDVPPQRHGS